MKQVHIPLSPSRAAPAASPTPAVRFGKQSEKAAFSTSPRASRLTEPTALPQPTAAGIEMKKSKYQTI